MSTVWSYAVRRARRRSTLVPVVGLLAATALSACSYTVGIRALQHESQSKLVAPAHVSAPLDRSAPSSTLVATLLRPAARFAAPGRGRRGAIPAWWHGARSSLPVLRVRAGWLEVRLAQRPNGSTGWVRSSDAALSRTPYAIQIDLATRHLVLFRGGDRVFSAPAGIGRPGDPTPEGQFFVAFFARAPSPAYGAFVIVTSAHSNAITDWEESGDAMIAIHGPLGSDAAIGTTGARISHGCIRLHERDLVRLRDVPAGSPIEIFQ